MVVSFKNEYRKEGSSGVRVSGITANQHANLERLSQHYIEKEMGIYDG